MGLKIMSDQEFIASFEQGRLEQFRHRDHIRMAWIYLTSQGYPQAVEAITSGIRAFAASKNATGLYHETITLFWIYSVAEAIEITTAETFEEFISHNENLTRKEYLFEFYTRELVMSAEARSTWVPPDLKPMRFICSVAC